MAKIYTTDELIETVKRRAFVPGTQASGSADDDIVDWLNEAMFTELIPFVMSHREEYFVITERIDTSAGVARYRIPKRALGIKLREMKYRTQQSNAPGDDYDLPIISREDVDSFGYYGRSNYPAGFYLEGVDIVLVPENGNYSGSIIVPYFFRPGDLTKVENCGVVSGVGVSEIITASPVPSGWSSGDLFDIHSPHSGAEIRIWNRASGLISGDIVDFADPLDASTLGEKLPETGDFICQENTAAVPGLPRELHPLLAQMAAVSLLESIGDIEGAAAAQARVDRMLQHASDLIVDRVEGEAQKVCASRSVFWGQGGAAPFSGRWY